MGPPPRPSFFGYGSICGPRYLHAEDCGRFTDYIFVGRQYCDSDFPSLCVGNIIPREVPTARVTYRHCEACTAVEISHPPRGLWGFWYAELRVTNYTVACFMCTYKACSNVHHTACELAQPRAQYSLHATTNRIVAYACT